jgi:hypothetical protein
MTNINTFLKVLSKVGYPNPRLVTLAEMSDYDLDNFLLDLNDKLGEKKLLDFVENALSKISTDKGIKVETPETGEYVFFDIKPQYFDEDESDTDFMIEYSITDSKILWNDGDGNETFKSVSEINNDLDFSEWTEYDEMLDFFKMKAYNKIFQNCGFGVWW